MNTEAIKSQFSNLFSQWNGQEPKSLLPLAPSGSKRIYYRLTNDDTTSIAAYNQDIAENETFLYLSNHFDKLNLPVPKIYAIGSDKQTYLQEDFGTTTLYSFLLNRKEEFSPTLKNLYEKVVRRLADIQIKGHQGLDYSKCYATESFDKQSILWDLNSFKYYFIKLGDFSFNEVELEKDFNTFADYLLSAPQDFFMFRDFQTRNIMIKNNEPFFIDYQGGRKGALQYDLASLLFQAKANLPNEIRTHLLDVYINAASELTDIDKTQFVNFYYPYVLVRSLQVLGAYGFRGLYERKKHFLESIPFAIKNVNWLLENVKFEFKMPHLKSILQQIITSGKFDAIDKSKNKDALLSIDIKSFSYKNGIPESKTGHGGGFVFDCRFIHNPGRYEPYKLLTGRDESVINFLQQHSEMNTFINNMNHIVDAAIDNYLERSFDHLSIYFGCTGGQHRSVYAADQLVKHVRNRYGIKVSLLHRERGWAEELFES